MSFLDTLKKIAFPSAKPASRNVITRTGTTKKKTTTKKVAPNYNYSPTVTLTPQAKFNPTSLANPAAKLSAGTKTSSPTGKHVFTVGMSDYEAAQQKKSSSSSSGGGGGTYTGELGSGGADAGLYDAGYGAPVGDVAPAQPQIPDDVMNTWNMYNQLMGGSLDQSTLNSLRNQANTDAKKFNDEQRGNYKTLLSQLATQKTTSEKSINDMLNRAISDAEASNFQTQLQAQQNAASRGMGGQNMVDDIALRNNMSMQHSLADLYGQTDTEKKQLLDEYNANTGEVNKAMSALNDNELAAKYLETYTNNKKAENQETAQGLLKGMESFLPYLTPDANTLSNNYTKMSVNNANLQQQANELNAKVANWKEQAELKAADISLGYANLQEKMRTNDANIAQIQNNMNNENYKLMVSSYAQERDMWGKIALQASKSKDDATYQAAMKKYNALASAIENTVKADTP